MADKNITPEPTSTPEPRDFTSMSADELHNLIEKEGKNFIEQTKDGDINAEDYFASEEFDITRLMSLFFAFEYFERTDGSDNKKYSPEYSKLYELTYSKINEYLGGLGLYGPDYIVNL
jgi:hypothetical protein